MLFMIIIAKNSLKKTSRADPFMWMTTAFSVNLGSKNTIFQPIKSFHFAYVSVTIVHMATLLQFFEQNLIPVLVRDVSLHLVLDFARDTTHSCQFSTTTTKLALGFGRPLNSLCSLHTLPYEPRHDVNFLQNQNEKCNLHSSFH